jgi:hypothetical protein
LNYSGFISIYSDFRVCGGMSFLPSRRKSSGNSVNS